MTTTKQVGWTAVLNALAGTTGLDALAAANAYAGLSLGPSLPGGAAPKALGLLGALNVGIGNVRPSAWSGLNAVCNQIAGTSGLEALQALQIKTGMV
jgi:hypothetical protein